MKSRMHFARISTSERIRRSLYQLRRAGKRGLTTREWIQRANICAVSAIASELRAQGIPVECQQEGKYFRYRLGQE